jgi:hypothetical protein
VSDPSSLFTVASLGTLVGQTAIVLLLTNVIGYLTGTGTGFDKYRKWVAFGLSLLVALAAAAAAADASAWKWLLVPVNACLIFASATGLNAMTPANRKAQQQQVASAEQPQFFRPWV